MCASFSFYTTSAKHTKTQLENTQLNPVFLSSFSACLGFKGSLGGGGGLWYVVGKEENNEK
jgi:hypothetical protein